MALVRTLTFLLFLSHVSSQSQSQSQSQNLRFTFEGFNGRESNLTSNGASIIKPSGVLRLTNLSQNIIGQSFYNKKFQMFTENHNSSFSTHFVFAIVTPTSGRGGYGLAFTISPKSSFPEADSEHYLGLFNKNNDGKEENQILVVEFDTVNGHNENADSNGNHVGININGMSSNTSKPAGYYKEGSEDNEEDLDLESGDPIQAWIDYDGKNKRITVTIAPFWVEKRPSKPLLTYDVDLATVLSDDLFVGFSSSTGKKSSNHYVLGWSFATNGQAPPLNLSRLPSKEI